MLHVRLWISVEVNYSSTAKPSERRREHCSIILCSRKRGIIRTVEIGTLARNERSFVEPISSVIRMFGSDRICLRSPDHDTSVMTSSDRSICLWRPCPALVGRSPISCGASGNGEHWGINHAGFVRRAPSGAAVHRSSGPPAGGSRWAAHGDRARFRGFDAAQIRMGPVGLGGAPDGADPVAGLGGSQPSHRTDSERSLAVQLCLCRVETGRRPSGHRCPARGTRWKKTGPAHMQ
jgi:hypothetical protein